MKGARAPLRAPPTLAAHLAAFSPNPMATNATPIVTNVMIAHRGVRIGCHAVRLRKRAARGEGRPVENDTTRQKEKG